MHHKRVEKAGPGDNVGMNIKGLDKGNMPRTGDVMILKSDSTLKQARAHGLRVPPAACAGWPRRPPHQRRALPLLGTPAAHPSPLN